MQGDEEKPKEVVRVRYNGIDRFNRPIFKAIGKREYYGCTDHLFERDPRLEFVQETITSDMLTYFGKSFGCEPMGTVVEDIEIIW